jgi:hypothetical protein
MENRDFDKLLWHVHKYDLERDDLFEKIPEINNHDEFKQPIDLPINKVIAYIVYTNDMNSPFVRKYDNTNRRKKVAAKTVGFEQEDMIFDEKVESMMRGDSVVINNMIFCYLRLQKNENWTILQTFKQALENEEKTLLSPSERDKTKDTIGNIVKLKEEIQKLALSFLIGDKTDGLVYDFQTAIESDDLVPRPEEIAKRIQQKEKVLPNWINPYREGING